MRRFLLIPALAAGLALSGCGTTGGIGSITPDQVAQVQQTAKSICSFVPTATTVAKIIASFAGAGGIVDVVSQAAGGICDAVAAVPKSLRRGRPTLAATPVYRGIKIQGSFQR